MKGREDSDLKSLYFLGQIWGGKSSRGFVTLGLDSQSAALGSYSMSTVCSVRPRAHTGSGESSLILQSAGGGHFDEGTEESRKTEPTTLRAVR